MNNTAIIIKKLYSYGSHIALIDQQKGRINGILHNKPIIEGSVIQYTVDAMTKSSILKDVEYVYIPLQWGKKNLLFLHHILEICYFFIPLSSCAEGIFDLLCFLFRMQEASWSIINQKIFLCKLFLLLGVYPHMSFLKTDVASRLFYISLEDMLQLKVDLQEQRIMDQWLKQCIAQHHMSLDFKTMIFFKESR